MPVYIFLQKKKFIFTKLCTNFLSENLGINIPDYNQQKREIFYMLNSLICLSLE